MNDRPTVRVAGLGLGTTQTDAGQRGAPRKVPYRTGVNAARPTTARQPTAPTGGGARGRRALPPPLRRRPEAKRLSLPRRVAARGPRRCGFTRDPRNCLQPRRRRSPIALWPAKAFAALFLCRIARAQAAVPRAHRPSGCAGKRPLEIPFVSWNTPSAGSRELSATRGCRNAGKPMRNETSGARHTALPSLVGFPLPLAAAESPLPCGKVCHGCP